MRKNWKLILALPLMSAALTVACKGNDRASDRAKDVGPRDAGAPPPFVALTGCLQLAPGSGNEFALLNVHKPEPAQQPSALPTVEESPFNAITEGSWVRLAGADLDELKRHMGERVSITGRIQDDGRSTIGTTGIRSDAQEAEQRENRSRAAADEHPSTRKRNEMGPIAHDTMANGTAPSITVEKIEGTGQRCANPQQQPSK
jgi:hypothetical protein